MIAPTTWEEQERLVAAAEGANEPLPPPWPVGTRVRYPGGRTRRGDAPWVAHGDVGVVVAVRPGMADPGDGYGVYHGASVVEFGGDARSRWSIAADNVVTDPESSRMGHGPHAARWAVVTEGENDA